MTHLHETEFVDLLDGTLAASRAAHLDTCAACRSQAQALRQLWTAAQEDPDHEPPALFWQHFTPRVREEIERPRASTFGELFPRFLRPGIVAAIAAGIVITLMAYSMIRPNVTPPASSAQEIVPLPLLLPDDLDADPEWAVVRAAAEGLDVEEAEAEGLAPAPDAVERVALELNDEELAELVRLVESELRRSGA